MTAAAVLVSDRRTTAPASGAEVFNLVCALGATFLTGFRYPLGYGVTAGLVVALVLLPVWVTSLRRFRGATLVVGLGALVALAGVWLTVFGSEQRTVEVLLAFSTTATYLSVVGGAGVLLWARTHLSLHTTGIVFGVGFLLSQLAYRGQWGANPWKFALVVPIAVISLSWAAGLRRRMVEVLVLTALAAASVVQDSRSAIGLFVLAALLTLWQAVPFGAGVRPRARAWRLVLLAAAVAAAVYNVGSAAAVEGYLGSAAQQRSISQMETSGSVLLGGRPELAATVALVRAEPWGFGPGAIPAPSDVLIAKDGMRSVHYDPDNGYVNHFMFGTQFRLHSVIGDLWAAYGVLGALWTLTVLVVLIASTAVAAAGRTAPAVVVWLVTLCAWNTFFGPFYGSAPALLAALGLALLPAQPRPYSSSR